MINIVNPQNRTLEEIEMDVARCSGFVKMMCGYANNGAYLFMMDALDKLRQHPRYDKKIRKLYEGKTNSVLAFYRDYRNSLRWPVGSALRFFHVDDMNDRPRNAFADGMTDAQYFEFWESTGALCYTKSRPWVTSLANKFRLSLLKHNIPHPEIAAWALVGSAILELAIEVFNRAVNSVCNAVPELRRDILEKVYKVFSLEKVAEQWHKASFAMFPEADGYGLTEIEKKNIAMGLNQLRELWANPELPFDASINAVEDYSDEIFRTKGYAKKTIRELSESRNEAVESLKEYKESKKILQNDTIRKETTCT